MKKTRLELLDISRGIFLFGILVDHLRNFPSIFLFLTGGAYLWVSFAAGFFVISGFIYGYKNSLQEISFGSLVKHAWSRAAKLYFWGIALTLLFTVWGNYLPVEIRKMGLWEIETSNLFRLVVDTLTLKYIYGWADFLPYYSLYLLFSPFVLLGIKYLKTWPILLMSLIVWYFRGDNIYLAYQIVFFAGMALGLNHSYLVERLLKLSSHTRKVLLKLVIFLFIGSLVLCLISVFFIKNISNLGISLNSSIMYFIHKNNVLNLYFDKKLLGFGRLLLIPIWYGAFFIFMHKNINSFKNFIGEALRDWGKNSLFVYILHSIIVFASPYLIFKIGLNGFWDYTLYVGLVLLLVNYVVKIKSRFWPYKTIFD